ncbi:MAG: RluA family pseudouridine synthase [Alphaproteobacteria bacterium]|nr:RluA family pseudouridine synthase [Alphaproteobacteria bacterium]
MIGFTTNNLNIIVDENNLKSNRATRLDRWLTDSVANTPDFPKLSRTRLKHLIQNMCVSCDEKIVSDPSQTVKLGQIYRIKIPEPKPAEPTAQAIELDIIYEDTHLIVINKSAGMVVHPAPGSQDGTLVNALLSHCGNTLSGIGGVRRPGIVHRLDKDTTGLMVVAKSDEAHQHLVHQFAARTIKRAYQALIWGILEKPKGTIDMPIGRSPRNRKKMAVVKRGGKQAVTNYRVKEQFGQTVSLLKCQLESGRTHQIRVHLSHIGHSLIGDPLYGSRKGSNSEKGPILGLIKNIGRQALHAKSLDFIHPYTRNLVHFSSSLPNDMRQIIDALRDNKSF